MPNIDIRKADSAQAGRKPSRLLIHLFHTAYLLITTAIKMQSPPSVAIIP